MWTGLQLLKARSPIVQAASRSQNRHTIIQALVPIGVTAIRARKFPFRAIPLYVYVDGQVTLVQVDYLDPPRKWARLTMDSANHGIRPGFSAKHYPLARSDSRHL